MILSFELPVGVVPVQFILRPNFKFREKFQLEILHSVPCSVVLVVFVVVFKWCMLGFAIAQVVRHWAVTLEVWS
jgi:hypothetical protein